MHNDEKTRRYLELIETHRRLIYKVCYLYASDSDHLNDLYQEVTANIWLGIDSFKSESKPGTWIYRVALNTCITYFRRNDRHNHSLPLDEVSLSAAVDDPESDRSALLRQMYQLIASLGKLDKALIMLWLDEYTYEEIASLTGLKRNNVASRLLRARRQLVKLSNM